MKVTPRGRIELVLMAAILAAPSVARGASDDEEEVVVAAEAKKAEPSPKPAVRSDPLERARAGEGGWLEDLVRPFSVKAFLQADYRGSQASEDEVQQGGVLLNENRFLLKTARARVDGNWKYAHAQLELEANTVKAPTIRPYHLFGTLRLPNPKEPKVPIAAASMGLFDTPFGFEAPESPATRWFMDRTTSSKAFFPGVPDLGLWVYGGLGPFRWAFAAMNGEPLDSTYQGVAPVAAKQVVFRLGFDAHPRGDLEISGDVSGLRGRGFHPGTDASKNLVAWTDTNEDGAIQPAELTGQAATAAVPSQLFDRWAIGADLQVRLRTKLGLTTVSGELTVADNLDRGLYIADPVFLGQDTRELGAYAAITQELTKWAVVGFRYDYYDPNLDAFDKRAGKLIPTNETIQTFSPLVGFVLPGVAEGSGGEALGKARLLFQYDFIRDHLARDPSGLPADMKNDSFTVRLQVEL